MAITNFIAAIELGSSKISGIAGKKNNDGTLQVYAFASEESASFVQKGIVYNVDKAAQALKFIITELEKQLGSSIAKIYVGISGQSLRTIKNTVGRTLEEESIISDQVIDEICEENHNTEICDMDILDVAPQEYKIDNKLQAEPVGVTGQQVTGQFLNIVARNSLKRNLERSLTQAQIEIADDLIVSPLALAKAILTENEMRIGCALVDMGADTTTIAIYKNNFLRHLCVLPLGGNSITRDITSLQMEQEEAEQLKVTYGDALYKESENETAATCQTEDGRIIELNTLNDIIGARTEEILANVNHQIILSEYNDKLYAGVIFTGGGANLKNLEAAFRAKSRIEKVKTIFSISSEVNGLDNNLLQCGKFNTLMGLLMWGKENCSKPEAPKAIKPGTSEDLFKDDENLKAQVIKDKENTNNNKIENPKQNDPGKPSGSKGGDKNNNKNGNKISSIITNFAGKLFGEDAEMKD